MSRIGKKPINIPAGVSFDLSENLITVKGPKGSLQMYLPPYVITTQSGNTITVALKKDAPRQATGQWGLARTLIDNLMTGVTQGFSKQLEINGVGFKAALQGKNLVLNVGFSHPVEYPIPPGIEIKVEKNIITISGADKQMVGQISAEIRAIKKPEPYKGKGIKYSTETIIRKEGKVVKAG
jgi:large subunit ribosomal protein L6